MSGDKPKVVFVLGAPGAGKGTQCEKIVKEFGYVHLSAGDLLRAERNRPGSELGGMIEDHIRQGKIVPVAVTCSLLENAMNECMAVGDSIVFNVDACAILIYSHVFVFFLQSDGNKNKFLIDGFPRNKDNLDGWTEQMDNKVILKFILFFDCTEAVCIDRCLGRNSGRSDDNIDTLKSRFDVFYRDSMPIVEFYDRQNLVRNIDGIPSPELVFEEVKRAFDHYDAK